MQRQLVYKIITILLLILLLSIPLLIISNLGWQRMQLRDAVVSEIARSYARNQTIMGPILVVPYSKKVMTGNNNIYEDQGNLYFLPETFKLEGNLEVENRKRGIYEARVYNLINNQITGIFNIPDNFGIDASQLASYKFEQPFLIIGVHDIRGLNKPIEFTFNGNKLDILPGTRSLLGDGIQASLDKTLLMQGGNFSYQLAFQLKGTSSLQISPVGKETTVNLQSNWPHPSFEGNFLPTTRDINKHGFSANWQTNYFATNIKDQLINCIKRENCNNNMLGVSLINPVDQYLKSDRAIKYSLLIIGLTFFCCFIFETIKRLSLHPIQYSFIGIALALFFLLLLSLSEHIGFSLAYFCSALSCISLISFYMMGILSNKRQSIIFCMALIALYGMLYVLLNIEDYSLLMGSIFVFGVFAGAMLVTRKLNWYQIATFSQVSLSKEKAKQEHYHD